MIHWVLIDSLQDCLSFCTSVKSYLSYYLQKCKCNFINIKTTLSFDSCVFSFLFLFCLTNWRISRVVFIRTFGSRHRELFCKTVIRHDITKVVFFKTGVIFQYSLLNTNVYKFIKNEIFRGHFSMAMIKRSILQLCRTTIFLTQLWMGASYYLFSKCDQKCRQVNNQIITHQIGEALWNCCLVLSNGCSVLYIASYKSRRNDSIALKLSTVQPQ